MADTLRETRHMLPDFDIGEYTYGCPQIEHADSGAKLKIGKFCSIANSVKILLGGEHTLYAPSTYPFAHFPGTFHSAGEPDPCTRGDVEIGNDVWIGDGALILCGTRICDGAVIGARAVVRGIIGPYEIVAGNPASFIRSRFACIDWPERENVVKRMIALAWWDWPIEKIQRYADLLCHGPVEEFLSKVEAES